MSTPYVGEIRLFGFPRVPTGWLACDGSTYAISTYDVLYTLLGTTFGGDGQSNFAVPDLRGRVPVHQGTGLGLTPRTPGEVFGTESVTLLTPQIPTHTHALVASQAAAASATPDSASFLGNVAPNDVWYFTQQGVAKAESMNASVIGATGGSLPHDNCMPTLTGNYCIAYQGIFPQQN
jgi:microcystin-dependent protein